MLVQQVNIVSISQTKSTLNKTDLGAWSIILSHSLVSNHASQANIFWAIGVLFDGTYVRETEDFDPNQIDLF